MLLNRKMNELEKSLQDLRTDLLGWLAAPTAILVFFLFLISNRIYGFQPPFLYAVVGLVILTSLSAQELRANHPILAAWTYLGGLTSASVALIWFSSSLLTISTLPVILMISIALVGIPPMLLATGLFTVAVLGAAVFRQALDSSIYAPVIILWLTALASWLSYRNLTTALEWGIQFYEQSKKSLDETRYHRGELARTLKSLDEAYHRLERFSLQLAQAQEVAEEARRVKQLFVANVSHELRTPLNIIIGFSEMLAFSPESYLKEGDDLQAIPPQFLGDINRIYRCASHLKSLIDDVLDLSQIDASKMALVTEQSSIREVIAEVFDMMESQALKKGLELKVELNEPLPDLLMDRLRIRQVLLNLVSNAIRFTNTGRVVMSAEVDGKNVRVSVLDTGPGIAEKDLNIVFEDFRQLDMTSSKRYEGTGLGLALSRRFIEMHGGRMWVESKLGEGSCFHFTLPISIRTPLSMTNLSRPVSYLAQFSGQVERPILVVSEEPMVVNLLKRHLNEVKVVGVAPKDLPAALDNYLPVAVIAGAPPTPEAASWLETTTRQVPLITCPLPEPSHIVQILGVDHYLVKPILRERLLEVLAGYGESVRKILIVDDDVQLAELIARTLQTAHESYQIRLACGGKEGINRLEEETPHLVILDLTMADIDGLGVLRWMRKQNALADLPVIILTARDQPGELMVSMEGAITLQTAYHLSVSEVIKSVQALIDSLPTRLESRQEVPTALAQDQGL